jgi:quercetin dioxygenase-like cupin family protein
MRVVRIGEDAKGWLAGPWESSLPVSIGYATEALDAPHRHGVVTEVFLLAQGDAVALVDGSEVRLVAGDVLIVEPDDVRSFVASAKEFRCFVLHVGGDCTADRIAVTDR